MGQQVQFQMPGMVEQTVRLVVTVENAEKHKQMVGSLRKVFASRNRAHVTKGRFRGKVRVIIVGVLTVTMGKLIRNVEFNLVGKLCEIQQRNTGIYQNVHALLACNAFTAKNLLIPHIEPATEFKEVGSSHLDASGLEFRFEIEVKGKCHLVLVDSGASLSVMKPGISSSELQPTQLLEGSLEIS